MTTATTPHRLRRAGPWVAILLLAIGATTGSTAKPSQDPLAAEIERWLSYVQTNASTDEEWGQIKQITLPVLESARQALQEGRRLLALQRLAVTRVNLAGFRYLSESPAAARADAQGFEAEYARMGKVLQNDLGEPVPSAFGNMQPAAVRGMGEVAFPEIRGFYQGSLEFGRVEPKVGLFYLGSAQAQKQFVALCRTLPSPARSAAPPLRKLSHELDALEGELLAAYRPPAAIDRHSEFIAASAALNEARELDAAKLPSGALLRYLQAAQRVAPLRAGPGSIDAAAVAARLESFSQRLSAGGTDHSIGRLFLEAAQADLAHPAAGASPVAAASIADDVLPRYFAALEPARTEASRPAPRATVTLVRWPYT